ncbi:MAG: type I methionyl aminopeptidase [Verrucomicrobiaceae bacterium]|nr:type I methionyl aminopeptidase [Verrucomicrobiaceae bacterium]
MAKRVKIPIKSDAEIRKMRIAGEAASEVLQATAKFIQPGRSTVDVDQYAAELIAERGGVATFLGYRGFPGNICISINEEVVHGIGGARRVQPGDLVSIDIGVTLDGWIGDNATTVPVGPIKEEDRRLLAATEQSLFEAIDHARDGALLADLCGSVENYVEGHGFSVVRKLVGHGVGRDLHERPEVPNYRPVGKSPRLRAGMVLAIEPMVNAGVGDVDFLDDGWTVVTADRLASAHFEHTVLVTSGDPEILTWRPRTALPEQLGVTL